MAEYNLTVNGVVLEGRPVNPSSCYLIQQVDGLDSRDIREEVAERAGRDGDVTGAQLRAGIRLIVTGFIVASSLTDLRSRERTLRTALAGGSGFAVTLSGRTGDPGTLTETFWVSSPFKAGDSVDNPMLVKPFTFSVRSDSASWRTTAAVNTSGSVAAGATSAALVNAGDVVTYPTVTFTATGTATIDYVENVTTSERFELDALPVVTGETIVIDSDAMSVLRTAPTSANRMQYVNPAAVWPRMAVGSSQWRFVLASGTAVTMAVTWRNRYL